MSGLIASIVAIAQGLLAFVIGALIAALSFGAAWALFWSVVSAVGVKKGVCRSGTLGNAVAAGLLQVALLVGMFRFVDFGQFRLFSLWCGVVYVPLHVILTGTRKLPDGRRAGLLKLTELRTMVHGMLHGTHH